MNPCVIGQEFVVELAAKGESPAPLCPCPDSKRWHRGSERVIFKPHITLLADRLKAALEYMILLRGTNPLSATHRKSASALLLLAAPSL